MGFWEDGDLITGLENASLPTAHQRARACAQQLLLPGTSRPTSWRKLRRQNAGKYWGDGASIKNRCGQDVGTVRAELQAAVTHTEEPLGEGASAPEQVGRVSGGMENLGDRKQAETEVTGQKWRPPLVGFGATCSWERMQGWGCAIETSKIKHQGARTFKTKQKPKQNVRRPWDRCRGVIHTRAAPEGKTAEQPNQEWLALPRWMSDTGEVPEA